MIGLVADDVTGACDSASPFLDAGPVEVALWPHLTDRSGLACLAIATDGRDQLEDEARERARSATAHVLSLGARPYKKVDSLLRGHVAAELEGVLAAWPGRVLLCPALPSEGRRTVRGHQVAGIISVDLAALVRRLGGRVVQRDAATDADLDAAAAEVLAASDLLPAGSAGLAAALARALDPDPRPRPPLPRSRSPLGLVGSKTDVTAEQVELAVREGAVIHRRGRSDPVDIGDHDALFLSGGGTAHGVLAALGATGLELLGDALPRAPVARIIGGPHAGLLVCVKSGGFGGPDAIARIFRTLTGRG